VKLALSATTQRARSVISSSPGVAASALELALDGLHLSRRLNKDTAGRVGAFRYEGISR